MQVFATLQADEFSHQCYGKECGVSNKQEQQSLLHRQTLVLVLVLIFFGICVLTVEKDVKSSRIHKDGEHSKGQQED